MNFFKSVAIATVILSTTAALSAGDKLESILSKGTVRIAVLSDAAPWGFRDNSGNLVGFDVDLAKLVAADLGVKLKLIEVTGTARLPSLISGRADILIAAAGVTPERAQQVMFSTPYVSVQLGVYGRKGTPIFKKPEELAGKSIAVARGSTLDVWLTDHASSANIVRFETTPNAIAAYTAGQTDYFAENSVIAASTAKGSDVELKFLIRESPAHAAVEQGEHDLLQWLNTDFFYNRMAGKLQDLQLKWFKKDAPLPWM